MSPDLHEPGPEMANLANRILGVPTFVDAERALQLSRCLTDIWEEQRRSLFRSAGRSALRGASARSLGDLRSDLAEMSHWLDPVASGKRLRDLLGHLEPTPSPSTDRLGDLIISIDDRSSLLTLTGRATLWLLARRDEEVSQRSGIWFYGQDVDEAAVAVTDQQMAWSMHRLRNVVDLLREDTATLRPTAAGLLLAMLINRNTCQARRLPAPADDATRRVITQALAAPALAFARHFSASEKATERGLDLYQGWAMGELARRLGSDLRRSDDGIWIEESGVERATARLLDAIKSRGPAMRARVPGAVEAALGAYATHRSLLAGLGLAHERPANTQRIVDRLLSASTPVAEARGDLVAE